MKNRAFSIYSGFLLFFFLTCFLYSFQYKVLELCWDLNIIDVSPSSGEIEKIRDIMDENLEEYTPLEEILRKVKKVVKDDYLIQILITKDSPYAKNTNEYLTTVNGRVPNMMYQEDKMVTFIRSKEYRVELYPAFFSFYLFYGLACIVLTLGAVFLFAHFKTAKKISKFLNRKLPFKKWIPNSMSKQLGAVLVLGVVCLILIYCLFLKNMYLFVDLTTRPFNIPYIFEERFKKENVANKLLDLSLEDRKEIKKVLKSAGVKGLGASVYDNEGMYLDSVDQYKNSLFPSLMPSLIGTDYQAPVYFSQYYQLKDSKILVLYTFLPYVFISEFYSIAALAVSSFSMYFIVKIYVQKQILRLQKLQQHIDAFSLGDWSYPIFDDSKDEIGKLSMDLEQLRLSYLEKSEQEYSALEANRTLITDLSHDLRTPLTILKGYLEILSLNIVEDKAQKEKYLRLAEEKVDLIDQLSNKTLEYAMVSQNKLPVYKKEVESQSVLRQVSEQIDYLSMKDYNVVFHHEIQKDKVKIDPSYWNRILNNLFSNILKYADKKENVQICLSITDCLILQAANKKAEIKEQERNKIGLKSMEKMAAAHKGQIKISQDESCYCIQIQLPNE